MLLNTLFFFLSIIHNKKITNTRCSNIEIRNEIVQNKTITQNDTYRIERFLELIKNKKIGEEEEIRWDSGEVEW
jgi:hypothetical protein